MYPKGIPDLVIPIPGIDFKNIFDFNSVNPP